MYISAVVFSGDTRTVFITEIYRNTCMSQHRIHEINSTNILNFKKGTVFITVKLFFVFTIGRKVSFLQICCWGPRLVQMRKTSDSWTVPVGGFRSQTCFLTVLQGPECYLPIAFAASDAISESTFARGDSEGHRSMFVCLPKRKQICFTGETDPLQTVLSIKNLSKLPDTKYISF